MQIAALREKAGLSQKDLARKLKTSQQQISRLECQRASSRPWRSSEPSTAGGRVLWSTKPAPLLVLARLGARKTPQFTHSSTRRPEIVSGGGNVDENRQFENPLSLTVKKQTTDSGSCRLVLPLA